MPQRFDRNAPTAKTVAQVRLEKIEKEVSAKRKLDAKERREIARMRKIKVEKMNSLAGDRTHNGKDLRKDSRQKMRFDKDMSMNAYSVEETGKYWHEDAQMTLAVISHARMIIASRKERKHDVYEHTHPTEIRRVEHKKKGGEENE